MCWPRVGHAWHTSPLDNQFPPPTALRDFRTHFFACLDRRADARFELTEAALAAGPQPSLAHLSLAAPRRRGWGSLYAALPHGRIAVERLQALLGGTPPAAGPPVFAVDVGSWPRSEAETSAERGDSDHPSRHLDGQPIVKGWADQWVAQLGFARDSGTAPADVRRLPPTGSAATVAADQVKASRRRRPPASTPLFVCDAGDDVTARTHALADEPGARPVRLRRDRCVYGPPPPGKAPTGRPRRNGATFRCDDPATWPPPTAAHTCEDAQYGTVTVQAWGDLHTVVRRPLAERTDGPRPPVTGTVLRVTVTRHAGRARTALARWLWWQGPGTPDLDLVWRADPRRDDIEQLFRFLKQTLNWTTPQLRTPAQAARWTWLLAAAYTQPRLARALVADPRLPWQRPQPPPRLTPARVQRGFVTLLLALGTPADAPKPCGRSPGRPQGCLSGRASRYPAVKKVA